MKTLLAPALKATADTKTILTWATVGTGLNVSGFIIGVRFGIDGVAWALLASVAIGTPIHFGLVKRALNFSIPRLAILSLKSIAFSAAVAGSFVVGAVAGGGSGPWSIAAGARPRDDHSPLDSVAIAPRDSEGGDQENTLAGEVEGPCR